MNILKKFSQTRFIFIILILLSLVLSFIVISVIPSFPVVSDSADYHVLALMVLENPSNLASIIDGTVQPPLYSVFLATTYLFFGHTYTAVYVLQFLLVGLISAFVFLISREHFKLSLLPSLLLSAIILFWPYLVLFSLLLRTEVLFIFLLMVSIWLFLRATDHPSWQRYALSGAILGVAALVRPVVLFLPIWLAVLSLPFVIRKNSKYKISVKTWASSLRAGLGAFLLVILPWIIVASLTWKTFIPISENLGAVFEKGNVTLDYLDQNITSDNGFINTELISAKLKNLYLFWNPGAGGYRAESLLQKYPLAEIGIWIYKIVFFILLGFAAPAFIKPNKNTLALGSIILYFWLVHVATFPYPRYMLPVVPLVALLAFVSFERFSRYFVQKTN